MADNLTAFCGDTIQFSHIFDPLDTVVTIGSVTVKIIDTAAPGDPTPLVAAGTAASSAAYDGDDAGPNAWRIFYSWATPATPAEAKYYLTVTYTPSGGTAISETFTGIIELWPLGSYFDRYIAFISDLLQESEMGERQAELGLRDYRRALQSALAAYNAAVEPATDATLSHTADTLTAGHFESVCWYAAALALIGPQAVAYLRTATPEIAAQFVNREPRASTAVYIALQWLKRADAYWAAIGGSSGVRTGLLTISDPAPWSIWTDDLADTLGVG